MKIEKKRAYYCTIDGIKGPHNLICFSLGDEFSYFVLTSQFENKKEFIEDYNLPYSTLVCLDISDCGVSLTIDTSCINCNTVHELSTVDFENRLKSKEISIRGILTDKYFEQILIGITTSNSRYVKQHIIDIAKRELELFNA